MHFTHVDNLATIVRDGVLADTRLGGNGAALVDVGMPSIKASRRVRRVPTGVGGVVADYVPFYFAPRSPMMSSISHGRVPQYQDGCDALVYLVTSVENLVEAGMDVVTSDRNAALAVAAFEVPSDDWGGAIDWDLMQARWWNNTADEPDRRERRMAECLVHGSLPWSVVDGVVTKTDRVAQAARDVIAAAGSATPVSVRPDWYI